MQSPEHIVLAVLAAFETGDRDAVERLLSPDLTFTSPVDNQIDRTTYFERCWPHSAEIDHFDVVRMVCEDDEVVVSYVGHTRHGSAGRNTECFTVRDGQVTKIEVYFGWNVPHPAPQGGWVAG